MQKVNAVKHISKENGEYEFVVLGKPASQQSSSTVRRAYQDKIRAATAGCKNIFFGEVEIRIVWLTGMRERYTTDATPDTDNILKPTLDALTGRDGLIFDDCQIQSVVCHWIDKNPGSDDKLEISLRTLDGTGDGVIDKDMAVFLQHGGSVYYLFPMFKQDVAEILYEAWQNSFASVEKLKSMGVPEEDAEYLWPVNAVRFHISRIAGKGFSCIKKENVRAFLDNLPK